MFRLWYMLSAINESLARFARTFPVVWFMESLSSRVCQNDQNSFKFEPKTLNYARWYLRCSRSMLCICPLYAPCISAKTALGPWKCSKCTQICAPCVRTDFESLDFQISGKAMFTRARCFLSNMRMHSDTALTTKCGCVFENFHIKMAKNEVMLSV